MQDDLFCPACGGELLLLGALGNRVHYRCRDCGLGTSAETATPPVNPTKREDVR